MVPVGSNCANWRRAISRGLARPRSKTRVRVGSGVWPGLPVREAVRRRARVGSERYSSLVRPFGRRGRLEAGWRPKRALQSERRAGVESGRRSSLARPSGRRSDCPFGLSSRFLGRPMSCALFATLSAWAEPLLGSQSMRDPGIINPTGALEPPGDSGRIVWGFLS